MQLLSWFAFLIVLVNSMDYDAPWIWDEIENPIKEAPDSLKATTILSILTKATMKAPMDSTTKQTITSKPELTTSSTTTIGTPKLCENCVLTSEYNPVCGTDYITYDNPSILKCAKKCGTNVDLLFHGGCRPL